MVTRWCVSHGLSVPSSYARCYPGCSFRALAAALLPRPRPRPRPWLAARGAAAMTAAGGGMFAGPLGWRTGPRPWLALRPRPLPPLRVCVCGGSIHGFDILRHVGAARPTRPTRPETGPTASLCEMMLSHVVRPRGYCGAHPEPASMHGTVILLMESMSRRVRSDAHRNGAPLVHTYAHMRATALPRSEPEWAAASAVRLYLTDIAHTRPHLASRSVR